MAIRIVTAALLATCVTIAGAAVPWHYPLYLGNDGYWRQRVAIEIRNDMDRAAAGDPVEVRIGTGVGEANLVGALAEAARVCDAEGAEMLYRITGPGGEVITTGPIPSGAGFTLPAECPAHSAVTYFIYFDNPAAWAVPDFLEASLGVRNSGVEVGTGDTPSGWNHDGGDDQHQAFWVSENPRSGTRCLKTVVAEGAEPTWIATRQQGIHIIGGAQYVMRAWVKADGVEGYAGWYIHVGSQDNAMMISPMLSGEGGTYDWKEVSVQFTAPEEASRADLGTVLRGTGTAWFDDVSLDCLEPLKLTAVAAPTEAAQIEETAADMPWYDDDPDDDLRWEYSIPLGVINFSDQAAEDALVQADFSRVASRFNRSLNPNSIRVTDGSRIVGHYQLDDSLLFYADVPARTARTYRAYFSLDHRIEGPGSGDYAALLESGRNLARNASFETGQSLPDDWPGGAEGEKPAGAVMGFDEPGLFGDRCARLHIPHDAEPAWTGWRQRVPVEPGRTYLFAAWLRCEDIEDGSVQLHAHYRNAAGDLCETVKHASAGTPMSGTQDWTLMYGWFDMPQDIATFELHLTMLATGTVWHDGVVVAEVQRGTAGSLEASAPMDFAAPAVWPVNAVVKVFGDELPPPEIPPARISAARNEKEPLQLAIRSPRPFDRVTVEVDPPANASGEQLDDIEIAVVGYVPIDHKTAYYRSDSPSWHRKYPERAGSCDGWAGWWPDPLLPRSQFALKPNTTQPIWVTVAVPKDAAAGDYSGTVRLLSDGAAIKEMPFTVHVWDFALPEESHVAAIYDLRIGGRWNVLGKTRQELQDQFCQFMADRRVCPDTVRPDPIIRYENGSVVTDFAEFDRAAEYYFNQLKLPSTYTPWYFYLFGWGHPPKVMFGERPYDGEYPYEGADRAKLRPEYKRVYQACLKAYWDHMKAKGWADKCVLYISDEPFYHLPHIREQMIALCDMIHEVDPDIPIYCSTWHHRPEWDGYLDVWGIGHHGIVPPEKMTELRAAGDRLWFTTDGQMCTDTPYCGVERLLPHYCFKYGVEAYEFWGISWLTYDPYQFGWHSYIHQSGEPGESTWVRYPNGDGFLAYPGAPVGHDGPVSSVRLEQAREGVEDYEYLYLLRELAADAKAAGRDVSAAEDALRFAAELVDIPNAGGRFSTRILPDPDAVFRVKDAVASAIEKLSAER
ncbi:MAG: DUF4091 domain-containing protein [Armatimonadota bacterium]|nr:MAG: DUF4091 domain-containing protein [Armatimonadota bacterium]